MLSVASCLCLSAAAAFLIYVPFCDSLANIRQTSELGAFVDSFSDKNHDEMERMFKEAREYNRQIEEEQKWRTFSYRGEQASDETYNSLLNPGGDGVMAELVIPSLSIDLPVAHGTKEEDLKYRCGHMYGTSLPIGGGSCHAVIPAHTGLVTADLFTRLDELQRGDIFYVSVLGETHVYEVRRILTILPEEESLYLGIVRGKDLVTLYTCTPYGINDHRLLVTGERRYPDLAAEEKGGGAFRLQSKNMKAAIKAACLIAIPFLIPFIFLMRAALRRRKARRETTAG